LTQLVNQLLSSGVLVIVDLTLDGEHRLELIQLLKNAFAGAVPVFAIHDERVCC